MPYAPFHELYSEVALKETRSISVLPGANLGLPPASYEFVEMFCNEPGCDCRRVMFSVISSASQMVEAVVAWGWESLDFYRRWMGSDDSEMVREMQGPVLNMGSPQTKNASAILRLAEKFLLNDPLYVERVKRHYAMYREKIDRGGPTPQRDKWVPNPGSDSPKMAAARRKLRKKRQKRRDS